MTPTKLLIGQMIAVLAIILGGIWAATQWAAASLQYQPELGAPWLTLMGVPIYQPWSIFPWWFSFDAYAPAIFDEAGAIAAGSGLLACSTAIFGSVWRARQSSNVTTYGSARWATRKDITKAELLSRHGVILVKPFSAGLTTNLVITTNRRTYHLRLASTAATAMAGISWTYPKDDLIALKRQAEAARAAAPVASGLDIARLNFDYAISGDRPPWRPLRAFDDGRQTFIEFPPALAQGDAPPLFLLGPGGKAELVNYRLRERYYVVDRLFGVAELRLGLKKQEIVRITRLGGQKRRRGA